MTLFELIRARRAESRHGIITMNADQTALTLRLPSFVSSVTRSRIIARSNSAKTPIIWNMARPLGVEVSSPCSGADRGQPSWHAVRSAAPAGP